MLRTIPRTGGTTTTTMMMIRRQHGLIGGGHHNIMPRSSSVLVSPRSFFSCWTTTAQQQQQRLSSSVHCLPSHFSIQVRTMADAAYVSRHNVSLNVSPLIIQTYCQSHGLTVKLNGSNIVVRECPFCVKPTNNKLSNLYKLYIESTSGAYFCHRCGAKGSWYDFKAHVSGYGGNSSSSSGTTTTTTVGLGTLQSLVGSTTNRGTTTHGARSSQNRLSSPEELPRPPARLAGVYSSLLLDAPPTTTTPTDDMTTSSSSSSSQQSHTPSAPNSSLQYLQEVRGLTRSTLRKYGVGRATYHFPGEDGYVPAECITFPWILTHAELHAQQESLRGSTSSSSGGGGGSTKLRHSSPSAATAAAATVQPDQDTDSSPTTTPTTIPPPGDDDTSFVTTRIKVRAVEQKGWQRLDPAGGGWGLFGLHTVPLDATEVVLTEGEYDAMAVHQATGRPAISLPNGCRSLPLPVLPLLERFSKIYLWMDNDAPGQEGAETFGKKLGLNRCFVVKCREAKDANEALLKGLDLESYIQQATVVPHERLLTFQDLRSEVLHELLEPDLYRGAAVPSLPLFTNLIKGFRRGEMTVLTGPTGSGKTTFLGQVSLDLAEQGMNVLWGSFEIKNTRLLHKLLKQYSRSALPDNTDPDAKDKFNRLADRFETLPLHFLKFHGGSDIEEVLDAMEYAVYVHDTEHIILDNMQFMITRGSMGGSNWEKFDVQDVAIEKFRKFATQHNVHLTLVVHPRKEDESTKLNISSFYGSAKATQEADTVLILQHDGRRKYVEVKKNRFDGTLGYAPLFFESKSGRYVETEGGDSGTSSNAPFTKGASQPGAVSFMPPQGQQPRWKSQPKKEPQPDPENLDSHWDAMLTPRA